MDNRQKRSVRYIWCSIKHADREQRCERDPPGMSAQQKEQTTECQQDNAGSRTEKIL